MTAGLVGIGDCPADARLAEAAARIGRGLSVCQLCGDWFPCELLSTAESCCAGCLADVARQTARSRRALARRVLRAELARLPGLTGSDIARITAIVEAAWA